MAQSRTGYRPVVGTGWEDIQDPELIYITDGSYVEVTQETYPGKVFWASGDHSAITTEQTGWFISKWNEYPLMKHRWDDSPYGTSNLKYYVRNPATNLSISGPSTVCDQATYTINDLPTGITVQWSTSNNNLTLVSGQGTGTAVFKKSGNGKSIIQADIRFGSQTLTIQSLPVTTEIKVSILGSMGMVGCGTTRLWTCSMACLPLEPEEMLNIEWTLESKELRFFGSGPDFTIKTTCKQNPSGVLREPIDAPHAIYTLRLDVISSDGTVYSAPDESIEIFGYIEVSPGLNNNVLTVYPNPATDVFTVQLQEEQPANAGLSIQQAAGKFSAGTYEIELWSTTARLKRFTTDLPVYQIPVSGLPAGIYFVRVIKDGEVYTKTLIKQ